MNKTDMAKDDENIRKYGLLQYVVKQEKNDQKSSSKEKKSSKKTDKKGKKEGDDKNKGKKGRTKKRK